MLIKTLADRGLGLAEAIPQSLLALMARIAAGGVFWRSGQTKLQGFHIKESTFYLFREDYQLPLIPPDLAAYLATVSENLFSVLLVIGVASRLSAAALLGVTAVIQIFVFPGAWPEHILWAVALLVVVTHGPGRLSIDHLLTQRPGFRRLGRSQ